MQPVRNSHIIRHTLRNYLAASLIFSLLCERLEAMHLPQAENTAFNPLHAYGKNDPEALSLRIVKGFCRDVNYRYASGVNCVYLNFDKPSDRRTAAAERRGR